VVEFRSGHSTKYFFFSLDGVHEALQRLIENAAVHGQASQEDAILVARYRDAALAARQAPGSVGGSDE
jgi:hypothetical protein